MKLDVFYCCYGMQEEVDGAEAIALESSKIWPLAQRVLAAPDDFFGVVDGNDTTLQVMVGTDGSGPSALWIRTLSGPLDQDPQGPWITDCLVHSLRAS